MVPAINKAKRLSSVNHTAKTIHHYHLHYLEDFVNHAEHTLLRRKNLRNRLFLKSIITVCSNAVFCSV